MTVYPQSYLPPKSQPWGRAVDKRLHDIEDTARINGLNIDNNLKQLNSSVDLLGRQQETLTSQQNFLASLQTYTSTNAATSATSSMGSIISLRSLSTTFTINRACKVLVDINAYGYGYADHNAASPYPLVRFTTSIVTGSTSYSGNTYGANVSVFSYTGALRIGYEGALIQTNVINLPAGTHTITGYWSVYMYGNSGYSSVSNASISASVIG